MSQGILGEMLSKGKNKDRQRTPRKRPSRRLPSGKEHLKPGMRSISPMLLGMAWMLSAVLSLESQETSHNRMAVQGKWPWQSTLGGGLTVLPIVQGDTQAILCVEASADVLLNQRWYFSFGFPLYLRLPLATIDMVSPVVAQGDATVEAAWIGHTNRGEHRLGASWTFPTGINEGVATQDNTIQTGGLLHYLDLFWQYTRYTDPISLTLGLRLGTSLPGSREETPYWEPFSVGLTTSAMMLVNRSVALQTRLIQGLALPPRSGDQWLSTTVSYDARLSGGLWYTDQEHTLAMEVSHNMAQPLEGLAVSFRYFYTVKPKER
ncbi:MAG TPA: hypothetical protein PLW34_04550 [Termitinemataceae bacterium]|nr:hypothetical protein [Termitinemataceae bacterium]HOM23112.1 hypothetical protein [Termitinemataceae bacterium]HPP99962.1 hypothetical protein [Termitinemataceae bacterium]